MNPQILNLLNIEEYQLSPSDVSWMDDRTLVVTKWNWDYALAHQFQQQSVRLLQDFPRNRILICCSHPHVFTNGRGLQKPRKGETLELKAFSPADYPTLPFPLHQIERGGGLTFHHPGQFIFYPIVKLNPAALTLSKMIDEMFAFASQVLTGRGMKDLSTENKLLGLWVNNKKIASMGMAIEKLTTFHGMALNLIHDQQMSAALSALNPCGLSAATYTSVDQFINLPEGSLESFRQEFLKRVSHAWK